MFRICYRIEVFSILYNICPKLLEKLLRQIQAPAESLDFLERFYSDTYDLEIYSLWKAKIEIKYPNKLNTEIYIL